MSAELSTQRQPRVLITGAAQGMGRAMARAFAADGYRLVLSDLDAARLAEVLAEVTALGVEAKGLAWDVADIPRIPERLAAAAEPFAGLDVLVNNAGVLRLPETGPGFSPEADWDFTMGINCKAVHFICQAAGAVLADGGCIVNMASDAGMRAAAGPYGISKWGVVGITKGFAERYAPRLRVNAIAPGPVATAMMRRREGETVEKADLPLGRFCYPEEIADVALALAGPRLRAVTGQTIVVNSANT